MNEVYIYKWFLVQDGATCHKSAETLDYLTEYCNVLENWPSGSPDLNPIENLGHIVKMKVEDAAPETIDELCNITFRSWEEIQSTTIDHLIDSMKNRLTVCIERAEDKLIIKVMKRF
jgi:hypothetical protein